MSWSLIHENCALALISDLNNRNDNPKNIQRCGIYLSHISRLPSIGQEMQGFFSSSYSLLFNNDLKDEKNNRESKNSQTDENKNTENFQRFSKVFKTF